MTCVRREEKRREEKRREEKRREEKRREEKRRVRRGVMSYCVAVVCNICMGAY